MIEVWSSLITAGFAVGPAVISGGWLVTTSFTVIDIGVGSNPILPASSTTWMPYQCIPAVGILSVKLPVADVPDTD